MTLSKPLLQLLSDGHFYSGTELGSTLGCSRAAVWKMIRGLESAGVEIFHVRGKGYRLAHAVELLNEDTISLAIGAKVRGYLSRVDVLFNTDSTNSYLLANQLEPTEVARACLAEIQDNGRGRRGRSWVSPFGGNLYLSLRWRFQRGATQLGALSLAVGVAVVKGLRSTGLDGLGLKWPNDIYLHNRKLAGVLLEISGESSGPCEVVIGVGINICSTEAARRAIDQPWSDIESCLGRRVSRNQLAGQLLTELINAAYLFDENGWSTFRKDWMMLDVFSGEDVVVHTAAGEVSGIARGVDDNGLLVIVSENGIKQHFHSGEVSLRSAPRCTGHV